VNTKLEEFLNKIQNDIQFFELTLGKIPDSKQKEILNYFNKKNKYQHFLERIFASAKYMLSDKEEKIMNLKSSTSHSNWVQMTNRFLAQEEREVLNEKEETVKESFSTVMNLLSSKKKKVRDSAAKAFNDILEKHSDVAEVEINNVITNKKINDMIRGMPRPDFGRHLADDIETEVVDSLVEVVSGNFDVSADFYKEKARLLGQKKLEYHERTVEVGNVDKEYSYEDSVQLVREVFGSLDPEFADIFDGFVKNGQIDVFPKKGKANGAFCAHYLITHPTYILLNHTNKLKDVLTLAHEVGHGINNELIRKKQNSLDFGTPLSTAEVASTFMEDFVLEALEKDADADLRHSLQIMKLDQDISTIIRQIAAYKFEQELHNKIREVGYLPKGEIGKLFQKHMSAYMGPYVIQSPGSQNWWVYWSHFRAFFYVYSYASGLLISKYMQRKVRQDKGNIKMVKEFLSAGLSDSPKNIFKKMGIDISKKSFWKESMKDIRPY
jgi:oligoendopeptidase F